MKKLVFTLGLVVVFTISNQISASSPYVDCFEMAINDLEDLESAIGRQLGDDIAMEELNLNYAACECVYNDNCYPIQ